MPTVNELLDWAEVRYSGYFPGRQVTQSLQPYMYRYYPQTGNYLGVSGQSIFILGPVAGSVSTPAYIGELSAFACDVHPSSCLPNAYPNKTITLVVPYAEGSASTVLGRWLAEALSASLGQAVNVQVTVGSAGMVAATAVQRANPDGYTVLLHDMAMATVQGWYRTAPIDPVAGFEPVGLVAESAMALVGRLNLPPADTPALLTWLRAQGRAVYFARMVSGTPSANCTVALRSAAGSLTFQEVPYKGSEPALIDLMAGQVALYCDTLAANGQQIESGGVKAYGVTTGERSSIPAFASLPTLAEGGLTGFNIAQWHGLYAPKGTPAAVIERLNAALRAALAAPGSAARAEPLRMRLVSDVYGSAAVHRDFLTSQISFWTPLIRANGEFLD